MMDLLRRLSVALIPWALGVYAVAFLSGGVYYLEQRVARIRDQFPQRAPLARLYGLLALCIGGLALMAVVGHLLFGQSDASLGALVALVAGVGFWLHRLRTAITLGGRIRAGLFALVCMALAVATARWLQT